MQVLQEKKDRRGGAPSVFQKMRLSKDYFFVTRVVEVVLPAVRVTR